jgi:hypothetical protein
MKIALQQFLPEDPRSGAPSPTWQQHFATLLDEMNTRLRQEREERKADVGQLDQEAQSFGLTKYGKVTGK